MPTTSKSCPKEQETFKEVYQLSDGLHGSRTTSGESEESADTELPLSELPKSDAEIEIQGALLNNETLANDGGQPAPISVPGNVNSTNLEHERDGQHPAHLYCRIGRTTHASLLNFGISSCPLCREDLKSKLPEASKPKNSEPKERNSDEKNQKREVIPPKPHSAVQYKIRFVDEGGYVAATQDWHEQLNLESARMKTRSTLDQTVLEVVSIVHSNIEKDHWRYRSEQERLLQEGILNNPKYTLVPSATEIYIHSQRFIRVLRQLVTYYPGISLMSDIIRVVEPYVFLFHFLDELIAYQETYTLAETLKPEESNVGQTATTTAKCDRETSDHITVILDFLKINNVENVHEEKARWNRPIAVTTYEMLWLLFKPGLTVYTEVDGSLAACVVHSIGVDSTQIRRRRPYRLELWHLDYNGRYLGPVRKEAKIHAFDGEVKITSLSVVPCEFYDRNDHNRMRKRLEGLGEMFYSLLSSKQMCYSGDSLGSPSRWIEGRVIIDSSTYYKYEKPPPLHFAAIRDSGETRSLKDRVSEGCKCLDCIKKTLDREQEKGGRHVLGRHDPWELYDNIDPKLTESLDIPSQNNGAVNKHRYLICPKRVFGFVLKSRKWEDLSIEFCHEPTATFDAIDTLKMPPERKTTIKALVHRFTRPGIHNAKNETTPWRADFIEHKGDGQIFLLHGSPGVGKTYTAECIAEHTGRPLLSLTCGDIGTDERTMEDKLSKWFRFAETWNAIMLIDEADIFLEKRATSDLQRNSLVAIFLRTMEYYRGILFLTTNRVGSFDDAFLSRIHAVIHYPNLGNEYRNQIWRQFFDKLRSERKDIRISHKAQTYVLTNKDMQGVPWNGREIRNAFQTAVALAEYRFLQEENKEEGEKARLEQEDFEKVYEMNYDFREYMDSISGTDESGRARQARERNDEYRRSKEGDVK